MNRTLQIAIGFTLGSVAYSVLVGKPVNPDILFGCWAVVAIDFIMYVLWKR